MLMINTETSSQIEKLYSKGKITSKEMSELKDKLKTLPQYTDREIQVKILENLRNLRESNNAIKGWMTFLGVLQILVIIGAIIILTK
jgi:hypothetical protein